MKIGICGGTFDPFHCGHLDPILALREPMEWDQVIYMPAFIQPFKQDRITVSPYHRYAMTVLGTERHDGLFVSSLELELARVSYTVDTLRILRAEFPVATLDWIIGDDNVPDLSKWKNLDEIFTLANFAVLSRSLDSGNEVAALTAGQERRLASPQSRPDRGAITFVHNARVPVSSTEIRRRVANGESIEELVPPPVSRYIHHYDLYRKASS
jgi:nicotinate-nucleotide adenylyltransferase